MILILVDHSGPVWTSVDQCGPVWTSVDQCGPVWTSVDQCGPVWTSVDQCGPVWTSVDQCGPVWTSVDQCGPVWTSVDQCGPVWTSVDQCGPVWTSVDQRGPVWTSVDQSGPLLLVDQSGSDGMTEMNARTLMFNLGPEDVIDSTTLVKIARYADRKQLTYKIPKKGTLLLDGRGKKIHLRKGVVTLRNALDLHALRLPERIISRYMLDDYRKSRPSHGDNIVLNTETNVTTRTNMLHVRKMALVDPRLLKSLHENTTPSHQSTRSCTISMPK